MFFSFCTIASNSESTVISSTSKDDVISTTSKDYVSSTTSKDYVSSTTSKDYVSSTPSMDHVTSISTNPEGIGNPGTGNIIMNPLTSARNNVQQLAIENLLLSG